MTNITLTTPNNQLDISLYGGHILRWQHQGQEILWLSELAETNSPTGAIRGGIPICFPWFAEQNQPKHGFARTSQWQCIQKSAQCAQLHLKDCTKTRALWPYQFSLLLNVELTERQLSLTLTVTNTDAQPWSFTGALHSYFQCEDVRQLHFDELSQRRFYNSLKQGAEQRFHDGPLPHPIDAIIPNLNQLTLLNRHICHQGSDSMVIWNPGKQHPNDVAPEAWPHFICIESAIVHHPVHLAPNAKHQLTQTIKILQ
ncbi:MAG: D-hexose-6-phosphate mutarotase [Ferrimonas sp.]